MVLASLSPPLLNVSWGVQAYDRGFAILYDAAIKSCNRLNVDTARPQFGPKSWGAVGRTHLRYDKWQSEGTMPDVIVLHPTDSVCVAARDFAAGETVELSHERLRLLDDVSQGHKIARATIQPGEAVLKWGQPIG